jgi:hypothetical protein
MRKQKSYLLIQSEREAVELAAASKEKYCCGSRAALGLLLVCPLMQIHMSGSEKKRPETMQGCFILPGCMIISFDEFKNLGQC